MTDQCKHEWRYHEATGKYRCFADCWEFLEHEEVEAMLNAHDALKQENERLSYLAYGPRHQPNCPQLWGAGDCRCGLIDRIDEWRQERLGIDALLEGGE